MANQNPAQIMRVVEAGSTRLEGDIVIGHNIRIKSDLITDYSLSKSYPIFEDVAIIVESIAYCDRFARRRSTGGWRRSLVLDIPVYEFKHLSSSRVMKSLHEAIRFLTGDDWCIHLRGRSGSVSTPQGRLVFPQNPIHHVIPFSDGLDSFAQARLSVDEHGPRGVMLVRAGSGLCRALPGVLKLRLPRRFGGRRLRETSYRTRPLVFYSMAAVAAVAVGAEAVVIGESGQGALGPSYLPFSDEWWFRSTHPGFISRWKCFLEFALGQPVRFEQPQIWKTKGEVLTDLRKRGLVGGWHATRSCSGRPLERLGQNSCGFCGGCLLRAVAAHSAKLGSHDLPMAFDVFGSNSVGRHRSGDERPMTQHEYSIAIRAIATMDRVAKISSIDDDFLSHEARLIDPLRPEVAKIKLANLLDTHRSEWNYFLSALPDKSWVRDILGRI